MSEIYLGKYEHSLDSQGRVSIPSDWRSASSGETGFVLFNGHGNSLLLFPMAVFSQFVDKVRGGSFASYELQELLCWVGERTRKCICDKQGRVKLDKAMLDACGVDSHLELIGAVTHIRLRSTQSEGDESPVKTQSFFNKLQELSKDSGSEFLRMLADNCGEK